MGMAEMDVGDLEVEELRVGGQKGTTNRDGLGMFVSYTNTR